MNFVGHIAVSRVIDASNRQFQLGSALPDLAAMARLRIVHEANDPDVAKGIAVHYRTDDAFHGNPIFVETNKAIAADLTGLGINRGAARACGHVGTELLLDGYLMATDPGLIPAANEALRGADRKDLGLEELVVADQRDSWVEQLHRAATWSLPANYRDPSAVAERLQKILARRPRLAFDADQTRLVAEVLGSHQRDIEADGYRILTSVVARVRTA